MPRKDDSLAEYRRKRDSGKSPEPAGRPRRARRGAPRFVIQQHDATSMHWDFRLEAAGVLKSWAVPKGPSTDPKEKRLAMPTEDHPLDYAGFEGVIPEGEYGAGPVIVWDAGTYRNLTEKDGEEIPVEDAADAGHVKVLLEGEKLRGGYALTRIGKGKKPRWILVKLRDEYADARRNPVWTQPRSVTSGKTIEELAAEVAGEASTGRARGRRRSG
jgi:DNA ligase D-like protein (predicted 3'-phosphoesterase)